MLRDMNAAYELGVVWRRASGFQTSIAPDDAELRWYGRIMAVACELATRLEGAEPYLSSRTTLDPKELSDREIYWRWTVQECALRLLAVYEKGASWITELERLGSARCGDDLGPSIIGASLHDARANVIQLVENLVEVTQKSEGEAKLGEVLSTFFVAVCGLLGRVQEELERLEKLKPGSG